MRTHYIRTYTKAQNTITYILTWIHLRAHTYSQETHNITHTTKKHIHIHTHTFTHKRENRAHAHTHTHIESRLAHYRNPCTDLFFALHALILTLITVYQTTIYEVCRSGHCRSPLRHQLPITFPRYEAADASFGFLFFRTNVDGLSQFLCVELP